MYGEKNDDANHTSDFSAEHIYKLILDAESQKTDSLLFMDILGDPLPW
jgi:hypothetical protein